ncbi:MAG: DUF2569 domain-containing protein [Prolixibacteraceae bacterium]|jgi:hypothetical protein|nr:DUF2569 domain-containing protein [Prolixibacteraceae bacterium]
MNTEKSSADEVAIGGWLILVLIGLIVSPIRIGITLFRDFVPLFDSISLFDAYPTLKTMIYVETFANAAFAIFALFLLVLMISKDYRFPKLMIIFYVANLVFVIGDAAYVSQSPEIKQFVEIGDSTKEIARAVIGTVIWVPYMLMSTRVERTFVKK